MARVFCRVPRVLPATSSEYVQLGHVFTSMEGIHFAKGAIQGEGQCRVGDSSHDRQAVLCLTASFRRFSNLRPNCVKRVVDYQDKVEDQYHRCAILRGQSTFASLNFHSSRAGIQTGARAIFFVRVGSKGNLRRAVGVHVSRPTGFLEQGVVYQSYTISYFGLAPGCLLKQCRCLLRLMSEIFLRLLFL